MVVKRRVALLLSGTVLGTGMLAAPAFADDAQLQQQVNALQQQVQQLQNQVANQGQVPSGLYNADLPIPRKGPSFLSTVQVSFAGSFIEGATVWRQRNELSSGASDPAFASGVPFSNTPLYSENEWRASGQQSRIAIKMTGDIDPYQHLKAYYESDFLGAGVTANSRESNSYNLRIRQAFLEYDNDNAHFHVVGGQAWSLLTQNRVGMLPQTENTPLTIDAQYVAGFNWARQEQLRFVYDVNKTVWFGVSAEAPQTAIGGSLGPSASSGTTTFPGGGAGFPYLVNAANNCNNSGTLDSATYCSNDVAPDFIEKVAIDPGWGHYEAFGLQRWFADEVSPYVSAATPASWSTKTTFGWGVGGSALLPVLPKYVDLQGSVMYGQGTGRYGSSQLPDVTYASNGSLTPLTTLQFLVGAVVHPFENLDIYAYYGQEQVDSNYFSASSTAGYGNPAAGDNGCLLANPAYANNPGSIGAGSFNSAMSGSTCTANIREVQEFTIGFWDNIYKGPVGRFTFGVEYEYVQLHAFSGATGATTATSTPNQGLNPNNNIVFTSIRYYPF
jgi:hypothetical protein